MATKATGKDSIAFGGGAVATEENALAIGSFSESKGKKSVAIGTGAKAQKDNAVVIGDQAEASFEGGVAIGKGARSEAENSIALGKDSKASQATGESYLTKQSAPTGVLSIGDIGTERRIQNVADGAADSDAATVRQLKAARTHYVSINDNGQQGGNFENDGATGRNAIAVGVNASAAGREAMAIGGSAQAIGSGAIAMGSSSQTVGRGDVAIGRNASTQGAEGVNSNQSVAIGDQTKAIGDQSVAIGADVIAKGNSSVAIGGDDVDKIARDTELSNTYTEITGGTLQAGKYPTTEANHGSTAVGVQAVGTGAFSSAFGMTSKATGDASSAFGVMSNASGKGAAAFGAVAQATGDGASAMGINSLASGTNSTAIGSGNKPGEGAKATGNSSAAIGSGAQATGDNSAAIGKGAEATNENAAAVGGGAKATGKNAAAIGGGAIADQENAVAVGQGAQSLVEGGVALGARSKVEAKNSVALGQDAVATEATGTSFLTNRDASQSNGVISVGSAGKERRITNVEDGSADSDAVTVRQLKNVDSRVNQNTSNIGKNTQNITNLNQKLDDTKTNLGNQITDTNKNLNDAKKDLGIQITDTNTKLNTTKDQLTTQINDTKTELNNTIGNTKTELNTKIDNTKTELENKGLNFAGNSGADVHRKLGDKLNIVGGAAASTPAAKTSGENIITRTTQDGIQIELLKDSKFDSVTTGNTTLNTNGLTIKEGPSITKQGINAGSKQITNVADGINAKDAVNVDQLTKVKENLNGRITDTNNQLNDAKKDLGNQIADTNKNLNDAKKDLGDQITDTNTKLNNTKDQLTTQINDTKTELNNTIGNTKTELENKGLNFAGNSGSDVHRKLGDKLNIVGGAAASTPTAKTSGENVITRTTKDGIQIELLKDSKFDSVTTGNTTLNTNGLTIKEGPSITKDGINAGGKKITNVADGINAKDAVNKSQLDNLAAKQNATDDAAVKYDDAKTKDKVTLKGKDGTVLDNVKAGHISSTSKEAVNGSQIHNISNSIKNSIGGNTVVNPDGSLTTNNIGGTGKNNINDAISEVKNTAKKAKTTVTEGDNIVVKETVNKDGSTNYEVSTKKDLTLNSVTTGDSVLNNNGLTIKEGPSITKEGINAGGKKITNVADGINAKDAVNVDQLTKVKDNLNGRITDTNNQLNDAKKDLGNQIADTNKNLNDAKKDLGDQIADTNTKLNNTKDQLTTQINDTKTELNNTIGNTKTELNTKIDSTKTELENKGLNFAGNSGADVHRKLGEKLNIVGGAAASTPVAKTSGENVITRTTKDGIQIELLKDSKFDSVTTGNTTLNTNGLTIKEGPSITKDGINAGGKKITNVADGINAKDAVNKSQLDNLAAKQNATDDAAVKYDDAKTKDKVTLKGKDGTVLDNVKAGHISSTSKEAVNGSQIHNISNSIKNSIGGNTVVNPDGSLTTNNIGGTGKNNINDAISEVKNTAKKAKTTVTEGDNIVVKETVNKDGSTNYEVSTKKDLTLNSVTTGDSVLNNNGLTIKEGPSITKEGINAGGKKITNVADGINAKDAVNVDQLTKVKDNLNGRITDTNNQLNDAKKDLGNQIADTNKNLNDAKKDLGDQIADTNTKLNNTKDQLTTQINDTKTELNNTIGNTKTELNTKIDSTKTELENKGLNFAGNSGADVHRKLGEKLNIVGGAAASTPVAKTSGENVITRTTKDGIQIELLKDSKFDSVTTGNTTLNTNGLTIKEGPSITKDGINAGGKKITNVADGINAKDAVNKSQLDNLAAKQNATDDAAVKYDDAKTKDKVTLKGKDGTVLDNVKAGHISSTSKEAVNGSQIHNISNSIKNSIGGNTVVNPDGSLTTSNIGGTGKNNINDAISEVKNTAKKAKTTVTEGDNIVVKETVNKDGSTNYEVSTKKDLTLNSVTTGDSVLNNNGLTIKDGPSITKDGINAGGKKITDVANGVIAQNSKDAVNGGQVHHISNSIKNSIGGNTVVNPDGSLTTNNIGGTGKNNINDAIKSVDEKVTNGVNDLTQKGLNFGANDQKTTQGKAVHRKLGDTINIVGGANPETAEDKTSGENIITRTTEDGVKIEMLKDVKFDSVNVGGHVLNQQGLTIKGGPSITVNGINAGGKQITNVADGINAKDAVNKGQLDKQINEVKDQIGKDIGKLSDHAVQYDKDKNGNVDKNSVTLGGGEKGTNLKNVADGKIAEGSKDAVNGGQLWNVQNQVDKNSNDIKNIQNNIDNISNGKAGLVQQQKPNGEITVGKDSGGTSINMAGKEGDRVVQGVKDGEIKAGSNQAVNGGQIHKISESIKNSIGGNTTIDPKDGSITTNNIGGTGKNNINDAIGTLNQSNQELGNKITNLGDQLQQVFYDTNKRIDDVEKKANAGIAAAMALENAPFVAGKYTYAVGAAYHGGENAVGVTLRKTSDNGRWSITGGVAAASQGEPSVRVGISGVIN
ncbi:trimeric autotransporter adhesin Ata [Acinetobacter baumannii]|uniref:trimeric autotransporter adhesin Ata n=1 Tax=Acinetobacter baumannii TaxID=470 RepID=UPI003916EC68